MTAGFDAFGPHAQSSAQPSTNRSTPMHENELQDTLVNAIQNILDAREEVEGEDDDIALAEIARDMVSDFEDLAHVTTFERAGLLTTNAGIVLRFGDGSVFQISIVKSH
jgi:hypothetical protein